MACQAEERVREAVSKPGIALELSIEVHKAVPQRLTPGSGWNTAELKLCTTRVDAMSLKAPAAAAKGATTWPAYGIAEAIP